MKNLKLDIQTVLIAVIMLLLFSCKKEGSISDSKISNINNIVLSDKMISSFVEGGSNEEVKRMLSAYQNFENSITVKNDLRNGQKSSKPELEAMLYGKLDDSYNVSLNGNNYSKIEGKPFIRKGIEFKNYYGTDVHFEIFSGDNLVEEKTIYIPKEIYGQLKSDNQEIKRIGNTFTWESDPKNLSKKVFFYYEIFNNEEGKIYGGIKGIEDNGSHNLDPYISDKKVDKVVFRLIRGNLFSTEINGKRTRFSVMSVDNHTYYIK